VLAQSTAELRSLRVEQAADGMYVGANIRIELAAAVEEALIKGIALTFVAEAQVRRDRWYWYDKNIAQAARSMRLSYQPLTRRWRLSLSEGGGDFSAGASLSQSFDQLSEALSAVGRISRWKIADGSEIESDSRHNIDFRFRLDTSQLPRPMQIGITGNTDWSIAIQRNLRPEAR
jgi:ferric-dicitrate binding protein FerR (iron transport regulator)